MFNQLILFNILWKIKYFCININFLASF